MDTCQAVIKQTHPLRIQCSPPSFADAACPCPALEPYVPSLTRSNHSTYVDESGHQPSYSAIILSHHTQPSYSAITQLSLSHHGRRVHVIHDG
eukprot:4467724-Pyramimonas_sp.AAC.1